ncbi:MAG: methionyl-tRNA formyltransferase [Gudongella sp.]|nr:methionyl-tRNA formyltransferase [Gudongella sp.]
MKIVFMGTPEFAVPTLENLYNKGYDIPLVITQPDKRKGRGKKTQFNPVKQKALDLNIGIFQPENINSEESIARINEYNPDFIVVVAYGQILKESILNIPKYDCLNIHASLLPHYRGAAPLNWVIINGEKETGVTIMKMSKGLDSGDMLIKKTIPITIDDDSITIHDKLSKIGSELIINAIELIISEIAVYSPQNNEESSHAPMLDKELGKIDWCKSGFEIQRLVKGLKPWPMAYTIYKDQQVKIHEIQIELKEHTKEFGLINEVSNDGIWVAVKDGYVIIKKLQFPGKKAMVIKNYLMGNKIDENYIL